MYKFILIYLLTLSIAHESAPTQSWEKQTLNETKKMKLIYVMDPHCGWCYGNSNHITSLKDLVGEKFNFELRVGGMWLGEQAPIGGPGLNAFLENHAPRMVKTTGADVGQAYYELAKDSTYTFSSLEPCAAIVLIKSLAPEQVFEFTKAVQLALFKSGKKLDDISTYLPILDNLGINATAFKAQWMSKENLEQTNAEFNVATTLASGFPTLLLQTDNTTKVLASGYFKLEPMIRQLNKL